MTYREADAVVDLAEALDLVVGAGLLGAELVAGEADDLEVVRVLPLDVLVQLLEPAVLGREAALGRGVDDEHDLARVVGQRLLVALLCRNAGARARKEKRRPCVSLLVPPKSFILIIFLFFSLRELVLFSTAMALR